MKCKLCDLEKPLLKKSHIIPDFMYGDLYTDKHKIYKVSKSVNSDKEKILMPSTGDYESGILCDNCDNKIIGGLESYASKILDKIKNSNNEHYEQFQLSTGESGRRYNNVNYVDFKLFALSLLLRFSISSRPFFNEVSLGPHEDTIRKMIYNRDPGESFQYPVALFTYVNDTSIPLDIITPPRLIKKTHKTSYMIGINGFFYFFGITKSKTDANNFVSSIIQKENLLDVFLVPKGKAMEYLITLGHQKKPSF